MAVRMQFKTVLKRLQEGRRFIQVLLGPRQVGKTTLVLKIAEEIHKPCYYVSADLATLQDLNWSRQQWEIARLKINSDEGAVLIRFIELYQPARCLLVGEAGLSLDEFLHAPIEKLI